VGPPVPVRRSREVLLRPSRTARLKYAGEQSCSLSAVTQIKCSRTHVDMEILT
jgi:hypothetical protein